MNRNQKMSGKSVLAKASAASLAVMMTATSVPATALPVFAAETGIEASVLSESKEASQIKLVGSTKTIYTGDKLNIIKSNKSKLTIKSATTSKKSVATVDKKGNVTAKAAGTTTIKIKTSKGTVSCKVTVKDALSWKKPTLVAGAKASSVFGLQSGATVKSVKSSKTSVATIDKKGNVTPKKDGTTKITVVVTSKNKGTKTYTKTLTVKKNAVASISVKTKPTKTSYAYGEKLSLSGLVLNVKGTNGKTTTVKGTNSGVTVSGYNANKAGSQKVTVKYSGKTTTFTVKVADSKVVKSVAVSGVPTSVAYGADWSELKKSIKVTATMTDGKTKDVTALAKIGDINTSSPGAQVLTVEYEGKKATATVTVENKVEATVTSIAVDGTVSCNVGDNWDDVKKNITVKATMSDGTVVTVPAAELVFEAVDTTKEGEVVGKVTYKDVTTSFTVKVIDATKVVEIKVTGVTAEIPYGADWSAISKSIKVVAVFADGTEKEVSDFTVSAVDTTVPGGKTVTVTYGDFTQEISVVVSDKLDTEAPTVVEEGSSVVDYQTMVVAFSEKVKGTPIVSVAGVAYDATLAEDGMSVTIKNEAGFAAGSYKIIVDGVTDMADNAIDKLTTLTLRKDVSYIKDYSFTSTSLPDSYNYDQTSGELIAVPGTNKVEAWFDVDAYFTAVDQYGQKVDLTASTLNNTTVEASIKTADGVYPLDAKVDTVDKKITIKKDDAIKAGVKLTIRLVTKDADGKVITDVSKEFDVEKRIGANVATQIMSVTADKENINTVDTTEVVLTADLVSKYGNPVENTSVKWVLDDNSVAQFIDDAQTSVDESSLKSLTTANNKLTLAIKRKGTVTIKAYLTNDISQVYTYTLEVGSTALKTLAGGTFGTVYNFEEAVSTPITTNEGASLTPDQLKYKVLTKSSEELADPVVTFDYKDDKKTDIVAKVTSKDTGSYTIAYYVGDNYEEADAKMNIVVATEANPTVTDINLEGFATNELTVGASAPVVKDIVFLNKHNEQIKVTRNELIVKTDGLTVTYYAKDGTEIVDPTNSSVAVAKLGFVASEAKEYTITYVTGTAHGSSTVVAAKKAEIKSATFATSTVSVIANDSYDKDKDKDKDSDNIISVNGDMYSLVGVSFADQYGNTIAATPQDLTASFKNGSLGYEYKYFNSKKELIDNATDKNVAYVGVYAGNYSVENISNPPASSNTLNISLKNSPTTALATLQVTAKADRVITTVVATPISQTAMTGTNVYYKVSAADQYGAPIKVISGAAIVGSADSVDEPLVDAGDKDSEKKVTLKASKAGNYSGVVTLTDASGKQATVSISLTAKNSADVTSIAIKSKLVDEGEAGYDTDKYPVYAASDKAYALGVKGTDAANNEIILRDNYVQYKVIGIKDKDGAEKSADYATVSGVALKFKEGIAEGDVVTVQAVAENGVKAIREIKVGTKAPEVNESTLYFAESAKAEAKAITEFDAPEDGENIQFIVKGITQYGQVATADVQYRVNDDTIAEVKEDGKIHVLKEGNTKVMAIYKGTSIEIMLHVSAKAATAANQPD